MKLLIDIGHPKDVHTFKHLYHRLVSTGHECLMTCRNRQHNTELMKAYNIKYVFMGRHYKTMYGKAFGLMKNVMQMLIIAIRFKPDLFISHNSIMAGLVSRLVRRDHIALEDTFNMEQVRFSTPVVDVILTGDYEHVSLGKKEIRYPGYHELSYLHPNVFSPDKNVLNILGIKKGEQYAIVRFVAWTATHDVGMKGVSYSNKIELVKKLSKYLRVFISSEVDLPDELIDYQIKIKPEDMHSVLAFASLFVGESSTMATEAAVQGVPAIYINNSHLGYIKDLEKQGLIFPYTENESDQKLAIHKAIELATAEKSDIYKKRRDELLSAKIDVAAFMLWFVENYPRSVDDLKQERIGWERFR